MKKNKLKNKISYAQDVPNGKMYATS